MSNALLTSLQWTQRVLWDYYQEAPLSCGGSEEQYVVRALSSKNRRSSLRESRHTVYSSSQAQLKLQIEGSGNLLLWAPAGSRLAHWYLVTVGKAQELGTVVHGATTWTASLEKDLVCHGLPPRSQVLPFNLINLHRF